ncbi:MAG: hypothetical protein KY469_10885 [Actinobacteria bacterium]|nr:hypothetical protein [Actinomycetota bacterium]
MAEERKLGDLHNDVVRHVLDLLEKETFPLKVLQLAEAYAWLRSPAQPHGSSGSA